MLDRIRWTPGIGDPTVLGWFTVFAYLAAGWLCLRAFMAEKAGAPRPYLESIRALVRVFRKHWPRVPLPARRAAVWLLLAALLFALAINKQLDLQSLLTEIGRLLAYDQGWYARRRDVQAVFIVALLVTGSVGLVGLWLLTRGAYREFRVSFLGLVVLLTFILIRATSFYHMDQLIRTAVLGLRMNGVLELSGIGLVAFGAFRRIRSRRG